MDQHFPGLMFLPVNLNNLGMTTAMAARFWSMGIVVTIHLLIFLILRRLFGNNEKVLFGNVLFLMWQPFYEGWVLWIDNFLPIFLLLSFYLFLNLEKTKKPTLLLFVNGLTLGLAIIFKQTVIPLIGLLVIYLYWLHRDIKKTTWFILGIVIPPLLMCVYFYFLGVFKDFWYWTVVFNLTTYANSGTKAAPSLAFISRITLIYAFSLLGLIYKSKRVIVLLLIFLMGSFIGVLERADFVHMQPSLPFMVILTTLGFVSLKRKYLIGLLIFYLAISGWWLNIFYKGHVSNRIIFFNDVTEKIAAAIEKYTSPGEKIFIFGPVPHLYQMTDTLPAGNVFVFQFPWFYTVAQDRILEGIKRDQPNIIVSDRSVVIEGNPLTKFGAKIDAYIEENYVSIETVGTTQILKKRSK